MFTVTFTVLWAVSCISVYFLILREYDRASRFHKESKELYDQAMKDNEQSTKILNQLKQSMRSLN